MHENRETLEMPAVKPGSRTAGEGPGRTARMHIPEESDSGTVPVNQSNKDERLLAEIEEGRPLIEENTHQPINLTRARHRARQACHRGWRVCGKQQGKTKR